MEIMLDRISTDSVSTEYVYCVGSVDLYGITKSLRL